MSWLLFILALGLGALFAFFVYAGVYAALTVLDDYLERRRRDSRRRRGSFPYGR